MGTGDAIDISSLDRVPQDAWERLAQRHIYFGHQSVGYNLLAGVADILRERPQIRLRIVESGDPSALDAPGLVHSKLGSNTDPISKLQSFANFINAGAGKLANAAFFKLCYVDINHETDVLRLFAEYERVMAGLTHQFCRVRFLHMTVPLTALPIGPKQTLKKLLGRPLWGYEHNRRRAEYNKRIRAKFTGERQLFDIAALESTRPDGTLQTFEWHRESIAAMYPGYTDDGGHLGPRGRRFVASEFLCWLAQATT